jgi:predicted PurR-regulated permease PerM
MVQHGDEVSGRASTRAEAVANEDRPAPLRRLGLPERTSLGVLAVAAVIALLYFGQVVIEALLISAIIAMVLAPIVDLLGKIRVPRALGAALATTAMVAAGYGLVALSVGRAADFARDLPRYAEHVSRMVQPMSRQAKQLQRSTEKVLPQGSSDTMKVQPTTSLADLLVRSFGNIVELAFAVATIPFLVYFMLSWQGHLRRATILLFRSDHRAEAEQVLEQMGSMLRRFVIGNVVVGAILAVITTVVLGVLGVPYFYFVGVVSGFLSLVPYLGVVLAALPPLAVGLGQLGPTAMTVIAVTVLAAHLFGLNFLYPKILGSRVSLNPLVVTVALLVWGAVWGAMGLVLAVPVTGVIKIVLDHLPALRPVGMWLGDRAP